MMQVIELQAIDVGRNMRRRYSIRAAPDLFGHIIVDLEWGRIGCAGQGRRVSFADHAAARRFMTQTLRRRASAKRRLGVTYVAVNA